MPEDTDLPPLDTDPGEWDDHWDTKTTITVSRWVKAMLDADRDSQPWDSYLNKLRRQKADPLTFTEVEAIADHLEEELSLTVGADLALDFPVADVKEAVREVLREDIDGGPEIPEGFLHVMEASDEQLAEIRERLEQLPEQTSDELEGRFR